MSEVSLLIDPQFEVAESPVWDSSGQRLLWVDVPRGNIWSYHDDRHQMVAHHDGSISCVRISSIGQMIVAIDSGIGFVAGELIKPSARALPTDIRMNDGACDASGRFWIGSMTKDATGRDGVLYSLRADGTLRRHLDDLGISNGIGWSLDNKVMYHVDSNPGILWAYEFDLAEGRIGHRRIVSDHWQSPEAPDGLCIDADGCIWVAVWNGGRVERLTPRGRVDRKVTVPAPLVTACTFGGSGADTLFITTARNRLSTSQRARFPLSGGVFRWRLPLQISGVVSNTFSGMHA